MQRKRHLRLNLRILCFCTYFAQDRLCSYRKIINDGVVWFKADYFLTTACLDVFYCSYTTKICQWLQFCINYRMRRHTSDLFTVTFITLCSETSMKQLSSCHHLRSGHSCTSISFFVSREVNKVGKTQLVMLQRNHKDFPIAKNFRKLTRTITKCWHFPKC